MALKKDHFALQSLHPETRAIFIWDEQYFVTRDYSLKRLVFIYETLCEMPVAIVKGDLYEIMKSFSSLKIQTFFTADTHIQQTIENLSKLYEVEVIQPEPFVDIPDSYRFKRFFEYWNIAKRQHEKKL